MINGVSLSQIQDVNLTQISHYRRISRVQNGHYSRFSQLDPQLVKIVHNRKTNHEKWKKFQQAKFTAEIERGNISYHNKLEKIKLSTSIYSPSKKVQSYQLITHWQTPNRKRQKQLLDSSNRSFAQKLINARCSFDHSKTNKEYQKYRNTVHRLQRFSVIQRMTSFSNRKCRIRTEGDTTIQKMLLHSSPSKENQREKLESPFKVISQK